MGDPTAGCRVQSEMEAEAGHGGQGDRHWDRLGGPTHPISFWGAPGKLSSPPPKDSSREHGV